MSYLGDSGETSAVLRTDLEKLTMNPQSGTTATFVAPGSVTNGQYGLYRWDMPAGAGGAGAHFHRSFSESFYVMSGVMTFFNGDKWIDVEEGGFLYVPPGGIHGFSNNSGADASMLILFAPGIAREAYFEELADIRRTGRTPSEQEWADLFARHDQINLS
ncbi:cupin domain-containing protein [Catelliglobosispora koreensis]|uniref:cupin domain-containing protein n=1 Tax=Catelliglobosispora koreensis TaxID=129052 RepID=UPI000368465D|nr:cupin domain-containing protein [Catelliglobosispora koreensis]